MTKTIKVDELNKIIKEDQLKNAILIDVRTPKENKALRIEQAMNIPLHELNSRMHELEKYDTIFVHCRSGGRSEKACKILNKLEKPEVFNVKGGILEWEAAGFDLERTRGFHLSVLRQVHIIAGTFILLGSILTYVSQVEWVVLTGLVGLGLLFAGLTGWCGLGQLLARMPWNK